MKNNIGGTDRVIRVIVAIIISVLFFTHTISGTGGTIVLVIGAVFLMTGFIRFCPLYSLFNINTSKKKNINDGTT